MKSQDRYIPENNIRTISFQIIQGLQFMHRQGTVLYCYITVTFQVISTAI